MSEPFKKLDPDSLAIECLFRNSFFEIPHNQREYRWVITDQILRFWEDYITCIKEDRESSTQTPLGHFLGTVVVIGAKDSSHEERYRVIDGQQRLTTLTCLARVLLDMSNNTQIMKPRID